MDTKIAYPNRRSIFQKFGGFIRRPADERRKMLANFYRNTAQRVFHIRPFALNLALCYQPDSYSRFGAYPEFAGLFARFTRHNRLNNGGDISRLWSFLLNISQVMEEGVSGDFAELGVWRGNTAAVLAEYAERFDRQVYLFDTYSGFDAKDITGVDSRMDATQFSDTSLDLVKDVIGETGSRRCHFVKGYFPGTFTDEHRAARYAVVSLDCDLYEPMKAGLQLFYPLMNKGGIFLLHDYSSRHWAGAKNAIDEFCRANDEYVVLMPDKSGSAFVRKTK